MPPGRRWTEVGRPVLVLVEVIAERPADAHREAGERRERDGHQHTDRAEEGACAAAGCDETKQAPALLFAVDVRHAAPEDRHDEQIENAEPDEENTAQPDMVRVIVDRDRKNDTENENV